MTIEIPGGRLSHVYYEPGRFLQAEDFRREQGLHQLARRRHHVGLHDWGIVNGFELAVAGDAAAQQVSVTAGYALDRQGRELVLPRQCPLDRIDLDGIDWETQALRILVRHQRHRQKGRHPDLPETWIEGVQFRTDEIALGDLADAPETEPAARPQDLRADSSDENSDDDGADERTPGDWLVLGALAAARSGRRGLVVLPDLRRLAGVVGGRLQAPDGTVRLTLGDDGSLLRVEQAPDPGSSAEEVLLEVPAEGPIRVGRRALTTPGLQVGPAGVTFEEGTEASVAGVGFRLRRVGSVLRCELPAGGRLELGSPAQDGSLDPCLVIDAGGVALLRAAPPAAADEPAAESGSFPWATVIPAVTNALVALAAILALLKLLEKPAT